MEDIWKIKEIHSAVKNGKIKKEDLREEIKKYIKEGMYLYVELEDKVCLGIYKQGKFFLGNSKTGRKTEEIMELTDDEINYLLKIRVFNSEMEWFGVKEGEEIYWRERSDREAENTEKIEIYDELHKIWGKAVNIEKIENIEWSLLTDKRGSRILLPIQLKKEGMAGLKIRRYIEFHNATELEQKDWDKGLMEFIDERFCGIEEFLSRENLKIVEN